MDKAQVEHLAIVLCNMTDATVDWAEVAQHRKIARKDNASTAFKNMMKKLGIEYANNKFTVADYSAVAPGFEAKTPKTPKTPKTASPRKRKPKASEEDGNEDNTESASPKKKPRAKKVVETEEVMEAAKDEIEEATNEEETD